VETLGSKLVNRIKENMSKKTETGKQVIKPNCQWRGGALKLSPPPDREGVWPEGGGGEAEDFGDGGEDEKKKKKKKFFYVKEPR